jgi:hypothetical protein
MAPLLRLLWLKFIQGRVVAMLLFNIYRTTQNVGTELVGVIEAEKPADAVEQALEYGITSYPGQPVWAEPAKN